MNPANAAPAGPVLRDIHMPPAPGWWPPAPGWWLVAALLAVVLGLFAWRAWRRARRRRAIAHLFDATIAAAEDPAAQVAAMSELLRRAARRRHPQADTLAGEDWLRLLDAGPAGPHFGAELGALLHDGAFRPALAAADAARLRPVARARFLQWMATS